MSFPTLYHAHHIRYQEDIPFWLDLARAQGGTVLELGCGSGRVLIPLGEAGFDVVGVDSDPGMLTVARQMIPPSIQKKITLEQLDFTKSLPDGLFSLVILPCNTFSTLQEADRMQVMTLVFERLSSNGLFVFSMPNPFVLESLPKIGEPELEEVFPHPETGDPVEVSTEWVRSRDALSITWTYDCLTPGDLPVRTVAVTEHCLDPADSYLASLGDAGFRLDRVAGDFNGDPFDPESPYLIVAARKD